VYDVTDVLTDFGVGGSGTSWSAAELNDATNELLTLQTHGWCPRYCRAGRLMVLDSERNQRRIGSFLRMLREARLATGSSPAPEDLPIETFLQRGASTRPVVRDGMKVGPLAMVLDRVEYQRMPLCAVIDDIGSRTGTRVIVDWDGLQRAEIEKVRPVTLKAHGLPAGRVLQMVLRHANDRLDWRLEEDDTVAVAMTDALYQPCVSRFYDIRDIILDAVRYRRSLAALQGLQGLQNPPVDEEGVSEEERVMRDITELLAIYRMCHCLNGRLVVITTEEGHAYIWDLLEQLRK
ncbi:MAG: hypothetical protein ACHRHE_00160, partial [Tepidisphaerales bacterium]